VLLCHAKLLRASPVAAGRNSSPAAREKAKNSGRCDFYLDDSRRTDARHEKSGKDPEDWITGEEPMTGPQRSYLQTLCREAGVEFNEKLTKAEASQKIEKLQAKTGRGKK